MSAPLVFKFTKPQAKKMAKLLKAAIAALPEIQPTYLDTSETGIKGLESYGKELQEQFNKFLSGV